MGVSYRPVVVEAIQVDSPSIGSNVTYVSNFATYFNSVMQLWYGKYVNQITLIEWLNSLQLGFNKIRDQNVLVVNLNEMSHLDTA